MSLRKPLPVKYLKLEDFNGKRSFSAALWAVEICNKIIDRYNAGDIVYEYENIIIPEFELRFHKNGSLDGLYLKDGEGSWTWLVGDICEDDGRIHCRKQDIREFFKLWRVAKVVNVTKVSDLTK